MSTRKTNGAKKTPEFLARAERAFARVALKVRAESRRSGLPYAGAVTHAITMARARASAEVL